MNKFKIYVLLHPITKEIKYVGKTERDINLRLSEHIKDVSCSKIKTYKKYWIRSLLNQGLKPEIKIIDEVDEKEWGDWEQFYIDLFKSLGFKLTNLADGGRGATSENNPARRPEVRKKISESHKGQVAWNKGKNFEELYGKEKAEKKKKDISLRHKGKGMSDELRIKKSLEQSGEGNSMYGRKHSENTRKKMSLSAKNRLPFSEETRKKIGVLRAGRTYEDIYGIEKARELKQKRKEARLNYLASLKLKD